MKIKKKLEKNSYKQPITLNEMRNIIKKLKYLKDKKRYTKYRTLKLKILSQIVMTPSISSDALKFAQNYLRNEK